MCSLVTVCVPVAPFPPFTEPELCGHVATAELDWNTCLKLIPQHKYKEVGSLGGWALPHLERGPGMPVKQCSNKFFLWLPKPILIAVGGEASSTHCLRSIIASLGLLFKNNRLLAVLGSLHSPMDHMEEGFSKERSEEHLERSDKAGMSLSQPHRDKTAHLLFFYCHLCGCGCFDIYIAKIALRLKCLMAVFSQQRAHYSYSQQKLSLNLKCWLAVLLSQVAGILCEPLRYQKGTNCSYRWEQVEVESSNDKCMCAHILLPRAFLHCEHWTRNKSLGGSSVSSLWKDPGAKKRSSICASAKVTIANVWCGIHMKKIYMAASSHAVIW